MDLSLPINKNYDGNFGNRAIALVNQCPVSHTGPASTQMVPAGKQLKKKKKAAKFEPAKHKWNTVPPLNNSLIHAMLHGTV